MDLRFLLNVRPDKWNTSEKYIKMKQEIDSITVTNDSAERAMALITTFNTTLTKDEGSKQLVLQVVEENRRQFPNWPKKPWQRDLIQRTDFYYYLPFFVNCFV
jgi:hypothetical protein